MSRVDKLTRSSGPDDYVELHEDVSKRATLNLAGEHAAEIVSLSDETSKDGKPYRQVGAEIISNAETGGETLYGPVFRGRSLVRFTAALGLDPSQVGSRFHKDDVIGKRVRIRVEAEEREGVGGRTEQRFVIREFAPLA